MLLLSIFSYFPLPVECPQLGPQGGASLSVCCENNQKLCLAVLPGAKQAQIGLKSVFQIAPRFRQTAAPSVKLFVLLKKPTYSSFSRLSFPSLSGKRDFCDEHAQEINQTHRKKLEETFCETAKAATGEGSSTNLRSHKEENNTRQAFLF